MKIKLYLTATQQSSVYDIAPNQQLFSFIGHLSQTEDMFKDIRIISITANGEIISPFLTASEAKLSENDTLMIYSDKTPETPYESEVTKIIDNNAVLQAVLTLLEDIRSLKIDVKLKKNLCEKVTKLTYLIYNLKFETVKNLVDSNSCIINNNTATEIQHIHFKNKEYYGQMNEKKKRHGFGMIKGDDKEIYFGQFKDGERFGYGITLTGAYNIIVSRNENKIRCGYGIKIYKTGEVGRINYENGKKSGDESYTKLTNEVIVRKWVDDKLE